MTSREMIETSKELEKEKSKHLGNTLVCGVIGLFGIQQAFKNWGLANRADVLSMTLSEAVKNSDKEE